MEELVTLSFPGLGIGEFTINKIIFSVGDFSVRWYAVMLVLGIIVAYLYACWRSKTNGLTADNMTDVALYTIIAGIVGARIYFVLSRWDSYKDDFWSVFKIWQGGIGIYGAIIGGGLALFLCCKLMKLNWLAVFDTVAPGVLIAQGIGRWGNFFNGEAFGVAPTEGSPLWFLRMTVRQSGWAVEKLAQPCFLYESLWCILGFILINVFYRYKKYHGQIFFEYVVWYGFGRMFIEGLRTDSLYLFNNENLPRKSQLLALICVVAGAVLMLIFGVLAHHRKTVVDALGYGDIFAGRKKKEAPAEPETAYDWLVKELKENEAAAAKTETAAEPEETPAAPGEEPGEPEESPAASAEKAAQEPTEEAAQEPAEEAAQEPTEDNNDGNDH